MCLVVSLPGGRAVLGVKILDREGEEERRSRVRFSAEAIFSADPQLNSLWDKFLRTANIVKKPMAEVGRWRARERRRKKGMPASAAYDERKDE